MDYKSESARLIKKLSANKKDEIKEVMKKEGARVKGLNIEETALGKGDIIPEFKLKNAVGNEINIYDILSKGPAIICFYRGAWCPYCNLELKAYQDILEDIKKAGGQLIAISPELPDNSVSLVEKHNLKFEVLSDINNEVARKFGLVFKISDKIDEFYKSFGVDLTKLNGNDKNELPVPATYVVDSKGTIVLSHVDSDYKNRLDPKEALEAIVSITN